MKRSSVWGDTRYWVGKVSQNSVPCEETGPAKEHRGNRKAAKAPQTEKQNRKQDLKNIGFHEETLTKTEKIAKRLLPQMNTDKHRWKYSNYSALKTQERLGFI